MKELHGGYGRNVLPNNECDFEFRNKTFKRGDKNQLINTLPLQNISPLGNNKVNDDVINDTEHDKRKGNNSERNTKSKHSKRTISFIGDSLLKDIKPYNLKHKIKKADKLYVQSYRGARTSAMKHHAKASEDFSSDIYLGHAGTNDLKLEKTPDEIANDLLEIGLQLKKGDNKVFISGILTRRDNYNEKGKKDNECLKLRCSNYLLDYIDNSGIITNRHLNQSGLHLNKDGTKLLSEIFLRVIYN